jgi:hypothetical protein
VASLGAVAASNSVTTGSPAGYVLLLSRPIELLGPWSASRYVP